VVRSHLLRFLETGCRPHPQKSGKEDLLWPLPNPEVESPPERDRDLHAHPFPKLSVLIDIAIDEKRFDDVVLLYERQIKLRRGEVCGDDIKVAEALVQSHSDLALNICKTLTDKLIARVKPSAYVEACGHLRLMYEIYQAHSRLEEWTALIARLRSEHKPKRRLISELDDLCLGIDRVSKRKK